MRKKTNEMKSAKRRPAWVDMFARTGRVEAKGPGGRDWHTDVPNIKLSRAFVVVLVLHVVAVGGILAFEMFKPDVAKSPVAASSDAGQVDADKPAGPAPRADRGVAKPPAVLREESSGGYERYIVQQGDSIRDIAGRYRISRAELLAANRIDERHPLVQGRILRVPRSLLPPPEPPVSVASTPAPARDALPGIATSLPADGGDGSVDSPAPDPLRTPGDSPVGTPSTDEVPAIEPEPETSVAGAVPAPAGDDGFQPLGTPRAGGPAGGAQLRPEIVAPRNDQKSTGARATVVRKLPNNPASTRAAADPAPPAAGARHTIAAGDNLYRLSRKYGVSVDAIMRANPGIDPRALKIGQSVKIP